MRLMKQLAALNSEREHPLKERHFPVDLSVRDSVDGSRPFGQSSSRSVLEPYIARSRRDASIGQSLGDVTLCSVCTGIGVGARLSRWRSRNSIRAWRASQAIETLLPAATAESSVYSSFARLIEMRCLEVGMARLGE